VIFDDREPRHQPHRQHPEILNMGLAPLDPRQWIETDTSLAHFHRHTLAMRARHDRGVYDALPASLPAQRELLDLLCEHLAEDHAEAYRREGESLCSEPGGFLVAVGERIEEPLWAAAQLVADDLVLLEPRDGDYVITAGCLASPSHWRLQDKLGRPMHAVHDPVPDIHDTLTPKIDRFFRHLKAERPVIRFNWGLQEDDRLYHAGGIEARADPAAALYYRVERQTLRRLPRTGAIAFSIRVFLHPLERLARQPGALQALLSAVDAAPPALADYKGFPLLRDALERFRLHWAFDASG
jgi:hypothetical protein